MEKMKRPWTDEDDRRLLEFKAAGRSALSEAVALRRSASAVNGRFGVLRKREREMSTVSPEMKPMATFDHSQPAILHDRHTDKIEPWTGEHAADYRENSIKNLTARSRGAALFSMAGITCSADSRPPYSRSSTR